MDRSTFQNVVNLWNRHDGGLDSAGNNLKRLEAKSDAVRYLMQIFLVSLSTFSLLWNQGGVGEKVEAVVNPDTDGPEGGRYTTRWWKTVQACLNIFLVLIRLDFESIHSLTVTNAQNEIVLGADSNPIQPFAAAFDVSDVGIYSTKTPEDIMVSEPEIVVAE